MFFNSWYDLFRVVVVGTLAYAALMVILRTSGKRTLAKLNAFDFIVTVALGSTLATTLLSKTTDLAEGVVALALLAGLQYVVAWTSIRSPRLSSWIKSEPTLLLHRGQFLEAAMRAERVTRQEIIAVLREAGAEEAERIAAVVLETNGTLSVIQGGSDDGRIATLVDVQGAGATT